MRIHLTTSVLVAAALAFSGCASSSQGSTADPAARATHSSATTGTAAESSETQPAVPTTLERGRLCGALDHEAAARALGVSSLKLGNDLEPGQRYVPFPGQPKITSTVWRCYYYSPSRPGGYTALTMQDDPATPASVTKAVQGLKESLSQGKRARCSLEPDSAWGPVGSVLLCTQPEIRNGHTYQTGYSEIVYSGLFGDVDFRCFAGLNPTVDADRVRAAGEKVCTHALAQLVS